MTLTLESDWQSDVVKLVQVLLAVRLADELGDRLGARVGWTFLREPLSSGPEEGTQERSEVDGRCRAPANDDTAHVPGSLVCFRWLPTDPMTCEMRRTKRE